MCMNYLPAERGNSANCVAHHRLHEHSHSLSLPVSGSTAACPPALFARTFGSLARD